jgi:6-phospho-beta-glucosidase
MAADDVVEVPMYVSRDVIQPMAVGKIPDECLGLIKLVKEYERLTISAATEGSYSKALQALTIHPLVADYGIARSILDEYRKRHIGFFPELK